MDGFGHTIETWANSTAGGGSIVSTFYDPCGCSPLGKVSKVSQPYAPNGTVYWTTYTYDASGRTTKVALPDGSATTYSYQGNTVTVTDPAGKTKTFTMDAFGNLTKVVETDPTLGQVSTNYTYDILNHLTQVSMPRGSNTQTRTFNYVPSGTNTVGAFLLSATNPENGTVTYTYSNGLMVSKTDAKGQVFHYYYDGYNRLQQIILGSTVLRTFIYDTNTLDGSFSSYGAGRLVAVQNAQTAAGQTTVTINEMYSYTSAGQPTKKRLQVVETLPSYPYTPSTVNMDAAYTYDTEGKMTSVNYPTTYPFVSPNLVPTPGPTYTYSYDSMSRPTGLTDQNNYAAVSGVQYGGSTCAQANRLLSISYFGVTESRCYNTLGQMTSISIPGSINTTYTYPSGTNNGKISSQYDAISGETVTYAYDSLNRLLSSQLPGGTNLALGKTATQSSTLAGYSTDGPGSAVDGNTDGNFWDGSVTATNNDANAWWQVDLGGSRWVASMNIWNRTDCCGDRLSDYWIFVSDQPFAQSDTPATLQNRAGTWSSHQTAMPNPSSAIAVGAQGRYVRVQLSGTNYLSLAEVQVWGGWGETYGYDGFGNLVSKTPTGGAPQLSIGVNPANNLVVGHTYDNNGNDSYGGVGYDAENRINSLPGTLYAYDSKNKRVWKGTFSGGNLIAQEAYFYGVDGQKLGTYALVFNTSSPVYFSSTNTNLSVYFGGKRVAVNGVAFAQDRLGSNTQGRYFPYGEDRGTPIANDQVKFATYTRDSATSLDYADQRYYSNQFGRFMTPDPYRASGGPSEPQSWNRYAYVGGDPINYHDPSGRERSIIGTCDDLVNGEPQDGCNLDSDPGGSLVGCGVGMSFDSIADACVADPGGGGQPATATCPDGTSPISGTLYTCIHQSGGDWKQFLSDLNDIAKALKKDTNCERFLTSGGTSLSTVFADLSNPKTFFSLALDIFTKQNTHLAGTTNDGVPGATPIILAAGLFANSATFEPDLTILHELGHLFNVLPADADPTGAQSAANDKKVVDNCAKTLGIH
jgi:RHS repeat-associated protein